MQLAPGLSESEVRTYLPGRFEANDVAALKRNFRMGATSRTPAISVVVPARNCGTSIAATIEVIRNELMLDTKVVDEILVVDCDSMDETAIAAELAGARVVSADAVLSESQGFGRGNVVRKAVFASTGDIVVFIDATQSRFDSFKVTNLIAPLLIPENNVIYTKAYYSQTQSSLATETVGRAAIGLFDPDLASLREPLGVEQAMFRQVFADLTVPEGRYFELSALQQVAKRFGAKSIAQVDLEYLEQAPTATSTLTESVHEILLNRLVDANSESNYSAVLRVPGEEIGSVTSTTPSLKVLEPLSHLSNWKSLERRRVTALGSGVKNHVAKTIELVFRRHRVNHT